MIGRVFRLIDIKRIEMKLRDIPLDSQSVLIRPDYMAICAADERYYFGKRKREALRRKLPMALIHEAVGTVLYDGTGTLRAGDKAALIPLAVKETASEIRGNYRQDSIFASSDADGFMRDIVVLPPSRVMPTGEEDSAAYVLSELFSVALSAVAEFEKSRSVRAESFGVWGDGSMGFVVGLALKAKYPNAKIYVFGKTSRKLNKFSFATETHFIDQVPCGLQISHAFECVGGIGSESAIEQMMGIVSPQGSVNLLGVSEEAVPINTRKVLEKGLKLVGSSRSDSVDFSEAIRLIRENLAIRRYLRTLISEMVEVKTEEDISHAFEQSALNDFKTVMKWEV